MDRTSKVEAGRTLGRYELLAAAGRGGMAEVFRARDTQLDRFVAVKVVLPHLASQEELARRFLREARLAASLEHPHILPVYDFGEQDGTPFLVMPWVDGGSVEERMGARPIERERALAWLREIAAALDHAHGAGVLHRDVKPSNVLLDRHDRALLADFGIAFAAGAATRLTRAGTVLGTPEYMAPELVEGEPASAASDLYALAVLAWELLAGRPPFSGESALSVLHQHANKPVPLLSGLVPDLPAATDRVFQRALAKQPAARPAGCRAFAAELAAALPTSGSATRPAPAAPAVTSVDRPGTTLPSTAAVRPAPGRAPRGSSGMTVLRPPSRRHLGAWLGAAAALAGVALGIWLWRGGGAREQSPRQEVREPEPASTAAEAVPQPVPARAAGTSSPPPETERRVEAPPVQVAAAEPEPIEERAEPAAQPEETAPADLPRLEAARRSEGPFPGRRRGAVNAPLERPGAALRGDGPRLAEALLHPAPFTAATFELLASEAERMAGVRGGEANARGVALYAQGGKAYLAGDDGTARARLDALTAAGPLPPLLTGAGPLWVLRDRTSRGALASWELAVAYGDARGEGRELLSGAGSSADGRQRFAHAYLARLHGDHETAIGEAEELYGMVKGQDAARAADLARFLAAEHLSLGRHSTALEWFDRAIEGTTGKVLAAAALEAARVAEEKLGDLAAARRYLEIACRAGNPLACRRLDQLR
ncbi:MAG TPA: protein kinase [Thermoanaerobaculia bacterium]|nr:protein kinase [Thermoanaerobaculia bacterium]